MDVEILCSQRIKAVLQIVLNIRKRIDKVTEEVAEKIMRR